LAELKRWTVRALRAVDVDAPTAQEAAAIARPRLEAGSLALQVFELTESGGVLPGVPFVYESERVGDGTDM